ncbi:MAG: (2Fe-2S)-binding protein, partial [Planctomycetaceae bacterium]|nr:(2Fe-2S)-binding protein [Planctomycetaceae bacterium]
MPSAPSSIAKTPACAETVTLQIDGTEVTVAAGTTIWQAARL